MERPDRERGGRAEESEIVRGALTIVVAGIALGLVFNWLGLQSRPAWGLAWIGVNPLEQLESVEDLVAEEEPPTNTGGYNQINDPMAVGLGSAVSNLPEIPTLERPVQIHLDAVKAYFDAGAALIVDAREGEEYAEGHIAGAINLPFDEVASDPLRVETLDTGGRPIIAYCGGGTCEVSLSLAWDLIAAGQTRIAVYVGGLSEWSEAGYPVEAAHPDKQ